MWNESNKRVRLTRWLLLVLLAGAAVVPAQTAQGIGASSSLRALLLEKHDLKPKHRPGEVSYYRLWMTIEGLDEWGNLVARNQWRGDFQRTVVSVDASGKALEKIHWNQIGNRSWIPETARWTPVQQVPWAEGFNYEFSAEEQYEELEWPYDSLPKTMAGYVFRGAFQCSAHLEFDFLRSSRHAAIEKLQEVGQVLTDIPEEGKKFSLNFAPLITNSDLERKYVQVGFPALTLVNGEPAAVIDYRQGPQTFAWDAQQQAEPDSIFDSGRNRLTSWQYGQFFVRLSDGALLQGEFTERTILQVVSPSGVELPIRNARGLFTIEQITERAYQAGLADIDQDNSPIPSLRASRPVPPPVPGDATNDRRKKLLAASFDLKPKHKIGHSSFYRLTLTRNDISPSGVPQGRNQWRGDLRRTTEAVSPEGKPRERVIWRNIAYRDAAGPANSYGALRKLGWAEGFTYPFSLEDRYADFPWDSYKRVPSTFEGYRFKLLTIDAHFEFDFLRSSLHGAIERLTHLGDRVRVPDNDQPFSINHGNVIRDSRIQRELVFTSFLGLTQVNGRPCAVIDFTQGPQHFSWRKTEDKSVEDTTLTSWQYGIIIVRLEDGSLEQGDFTERVMMKTARNGQNRPQYVLATFHIERISHEAYVKGGGEWEQSSRPSGRVWDR